MDWQQGPICGEVHSTRKHSVPASLPRTTTLRVEFLTQICRSELRMVFPSTRMLALSSVTSIPPLLSMRLPRYTVNEFIERPSNDAPVAPLTA